MSFTNNFSTSFRWWDRIFGTDTNYLKYRERLDAASKRSVEDRLDIERELLAQVEKEGIEAEREVVKNASKRD